jgi:hypothetical protein
MFEGANMSGFRISALAVAVVAAVSANQVAANISVTIPTVETVSGVALFDWSPSNVIAYKGNKAIADFLNTGGACNTGTNCVFDVFVQGSLSAFQDSDNDTIASGLGSSYQITYELGFAEKVNNVAFLSNGPIAEFGFGPDGATTGPYTTTLSNGADNFFRMYYNVGAPVNSPLNGTGFSAGTLVFEGTVAPVGNFSTNFQVTGGPVPIGGQGGATPAAWAGQQTVSGGGITTALNLLVTPTVFDAQFFGTGNLSSFLYDSISQALPYTTVNPSLFFPVGAVVAGAPIDTNAEIGTINGGLVNLPPGAVFGDSIIFQTDPNSPVVPAPATLALMAFGLIGAGIARRRRADA